jgi:hypothetical protein
MNCRLISDTVRAIMGSSGLIPMKSYAEYYRPDRITKEIEIFKGIQPSRAAEQPGGEIQRSWSI